MTTTTICIDSFEREVLDSALAVNTRKAYNRAWEDFADYCRLRKVDPMDADADLVSNFLIEMARRPSAATGKSLSMGTISILQCAISRRFLDHGESSPTSHPKVAKVMRGLKRLYGAPPRQVKALREKHIQRMISRCGKSSIGLRDAAIFALGFAAALRRSEICNLRVEDIEFLASDNASSHTPKASGMIVTIRKSKTDQTSQGQQVAVPEGRRIRPVSRLREWLKASGVDSGHIFRTLRSGGALRGLRMHHSDIPRLIKKYVKIIGLDPSDYAGHSLRAGFVTSAAAHHARLDKIMEVTRHTNPATVMKYIREADVFCDHAGRNFL